MPARTIEFHEEAGTEYDVAFEWYLNRSPDAARKFEAEVARALGQVLQSPRMWASGPLNTRRYLPKRFPFLLIYRELASQNIQIIAVAHTSRRPGYWKERI